MEWVKGMCKGWQGEERERMGMVEIGHCSRPPAPEPPFYVCGAPHLVSLGQWQAHHGGVLLSQILLF